MTTRRSRDGAKDTGDTQSGTRSRSRSFAGSQTEYSPSMMIAVGNEADELSFCAALVRVYMTYENNERMLRGGGEVWQCSTEMYRPRLISDLKREWSAISGIEEKEDLFPFHGDYVMRKWIQYRKLPTNEKNALHERLWEYIKDVAANAKEDKCEAN